MKVRQRSCPACPFVTKSTDREVAATVAARVEAGEAWVCHQTCDGPRITDRSQLCAGAPPAGTPAETVLTGLGHTNGAPRLR